MIKRLLIRCFCWSFVIVLMWLFCLGICCWKLLCVWLRNLFFNWKYNWMIVMLCLIWCLKLINGWWKKGMMRNMEYGCWCVLFRRVLRSCWLIRFCLVILSMVELWLFWLVKIMNLILRLLLCCFCLSLLMKIYLMMILGLMIMGLMMMMG